MELMLFFLFFFENGLALNEWLFILLLERRKSLCSFQSVLFCFHIDCFDGD